MRSAYIQGAIIIILFVYSIRKLLFYANIAVNEGNLGNIVKIRQVFPGVDLFTNQTTSAPSPPHEAAIRGGTTQHIFDTTTISHTKYEAKAAVQNTNNNTDSQRTENVTGDEQREAQYGVRERRKGFTAHAQWSAANVSTTDRERSKTSGEQWNTVTQNTSSKDSNKRVTDNVQRNATTRKNTTMDRR